MGIRQKLKILQKTIETYKKDKIIKINLYKKEKELKNKLYKS